MTLTIEALLADPEFDVEHFIHNVNLHESRPNIIGTLINDPYVLLSIAEGPDWKLLNNHPSEPATYLKMQDLGFEVWTKKTKERDNIWYGVIASDELAFYFRRVRDSESFVYKGQNAAEDARKEWKKLKMYKLSEEGAMIARGQRPIDQVRSKIMEILKPITTPSYNCRNDPGSCSFIYQFGKHWSYQEEKELTFYVKATGPYRAKVEHKLKKVARQVGAAQKLYWTKTFLYSSETMSVDLISDKKTKTFRGVDEVAKEIIAWLTARNKYLKSAFGNTP